MKMNKNEREKPVAEGCAAESFGSYFSSKIKLNVSKAKVVSNRVYNGKCKLLVQNRNFMTKNDVELCMSDLKNKKCEGFDRIPVSTMFDAHELLLNPMADLFEKIYLTAKS